MQNGYEKSDVNVGKVILFALGPAIFIVVALIGLDQFFLWSSQDAYYQKVLFPQSQDYVELSQSQQKQLDSYGVIDESKGRYQIPIDRAKQLLVNQAIARRSRK
ncbi:MAG: hypothetical protein KDD52_08440 [Bdellovibrionales bacterium]|nr:hypothetical protein [Bdellovibrionales bacterium]